MKDFIETVAKICHEANRAYCEEIGDYSQKTWEEAPEWQKDSARKGVRLHLSGNRSASESHESWMKQKREDGWKLGPVKDEAKKEHPCMVPFRELSIEQQTKDYLFRGIVQGFKAAITQS